MKVTPFVEDARLASASVAFGRATLGPDLKAAFDFCSAKRDEAARPKPRGPPRPRRSRACGPSWSCAPSSRTRASASCSTADAARRVAGRRAPRRAVGGGAAAPPPPAAANAADADARRRRRRVERRVRRARATDGAADAFGAPPADAFGAPPADAFARRRPRRRAPPSPNGAAAASAAATGRRRARLAPPVGAADPRSGSSCARRCSSATRRPSTAASTTASSPTRCCSRRRRRRALGPHARATAHAVSAAVPARGRGDHHERPRRAVAQSELGRWEETPRSSRPTPKRRSSRCCAALARLEPRLATAARPRSATCGAACPPVAHWIHELRADAASRRRVDSVALHDLSRRSSSSRATPRPSSPTARARRRRRRPRAPPSRRPRSNARRRDGRVLRALRQAARCAGPAALRGKYASTASAREGSEAAELRHRLHVALGSAAAGSAAPHVPFETRHIGVAKMPTPAPTPAAAAAAAAPVAAIGQPAAAAVAPCPRPRAA